MNIIIPADGVERRKLGFQFYFLEQQFKASLEQYFYFHNNAAEEQHEQIISHRFWFINAGQLKCMYLQT